MNWQQITFDWNQARAFLVTAEEGSLSAAARALGLTQPTLSRQVAALEEALGVTLFERLSKSLMLTEAGLDLLDHVREMGEAASRVSLSASGKSELIEGLVTISSTDLMASCFLPAILAGLRQKAPGIEIKVVCSNSLSDLRRREADIAIRHVRPEDPDLYARKIRDARAVIVASQSLAGRFDRPITLDDTAALDFIGFEDNDELLRHLTPMGLKTAAANFRISSPNAMVCLQMVREGLGITVMDADIIARFPDLVPILPDIEPVTYPVWLVSHRELHTSRRIRTVFDHLAEGLKGV